MASKTTEKYRSLDLDNRIRLVHNDKLYDITDFLTQHPGGSEVLQKSAGEDVTLKMQNADSSDFGIRHKHSDAAYRILDKYCISEATDCNKNRHFQTNLEEKDNLIDWNKPLFYQVGFLAEDYDRWVHQPVNKKLRLFSYDWIEFFNSSPWWMVPIYWIPVSLLLIFTANSFLHNNTEYLFPLLWLSFKGIPITQSALPAIIISGMLLWSLVEYVIHRWVFHVKPSSKSPWWIRLHFLFHGQHHKCPMDKSKLVFPQVPATFLALHVALFYCLILPVSVAIGLLGGTILGYMCYDMIHYYLHHGTPNTQYFKSLKSYHMKHHYFDQNVAYGISSRLWDYPFRTVCKSD